MPFEGAHTNDIALTLEEGPVCKFDAPEGILKSPEEIFEGGVQFFMHAAADGDRDLAERLTRSNMKSLPHWQVNPFDLLNGAEATSEEFQSAMMKFSSK